MPEIVIVGGGIIGLYNALVLSRMGMAQKTKVIAAHFPGDQSPDYTSPYAGGNFSCISGNGVDAIEYDRASYAYLDELCRDYGEKWCLKRLPAVELFEIPPSKAKLDSLKSYLPDLEEIEDKEFLARNKCHFGIKYTTFSFYSPQFLKHLYDHLHTLGVQFQKRRISHLRDAFDPDTKVVFNCTGVTVSRIGGVDDQTTFPLWGQVVCVRAPHVQCNYSLNHVGKHPTYIIPRPYSNGKVILGGFYEKDKWSTETLAADSASIIDRTTRLLPELLKNGPLEIIEERAGLRPGRKEGARIEKVLIDGKTVIHNYGAAGTGFQSGIGMALKAVSLYLPNPKL